MGKFKVGDQVRVLNVDDLEAPGRTIGMTGTVVLINSVDGGLKVDVPADDDWWYYSESELELIAPKEEIKSYTVEQIKAAFTDGDAALERFLANLTHPLPPVGSIVQADGRFTYLHRAKGVFMTFGTTTTTSWHTVLGQGPIKVLREGWGDE